MKALIKKIIKSLPIDFTRNQQYDTQTKKVIAKVCSANTIAIDVGCHKGEVLDLILKYAPKAAHYGFEPIPDLCEALKKKYEGKPYHISNIALSDQKGETSFNYVVSNPAYSGLQKRQYDRANEQDTKITVQTELLDAIIGENVSIGFVKIDVEGGELQVLKGAVKTIARCKPVIIFEHGLGASDFYGTSPEQVFELLSSCGMKISTMKNWLKTGPAFSKEEFEKQFQQRINYYFIAYPA
jgi:FkbM family methyltransferase